MHRHIHISKIAPSYSLPPNTHQKTTTQIGGARNARDLLRALQGGTATHPGDPARRVLLLLDGLDRFLTQGSVLIPTLSFLLGGWVVVGG